MILSNNSNKIPTKSCKYEKGNIFNLNHFSDIIKSLFDMYKRYPQKIWKIIKQTFQDYVTVISFIKSKVYNNTGSYESVVQSIWDKFWEHMKKIANTEELKYYFDINKNSNELLNKHKNPKELLIVLGVDVSQLTWDIAVTCEEWILCFVFDDHDMSILYQIEDRDNIPNWCLTNELAKYKDKSLPIILLRKDNPDIIWTKSHEIQHHINNTLFMKDIEIDFNNIKSVINDRFKDEIIAQAIHWTPVQHSDGIISDESITLNLSHTYSSYDFPFHALHELTSNILNKKYGRKFDEDVITKFIKEDRSLRNQYNMLREYIYRKNFDMRDCTNLARNMIKKVEDWNLILALTSFDNREQLKEIYAEELNSVHI